MEDEKYRRAKWLQEVIEDSWFQQIVEEYKQQQAEQMLNETDFAQRNEVYYIYTGAISFLGHLDGIVSEKLLEEKEIEQ